MVFPAELAVAENIFQHALGIVKTAVDRDRMHIRCTGACHLAFLQGRNPALWIENENGGVRFSQQSVNGRSAGVAGRGAEDIDPLPAQLALVLVKITEQLKCEVL